MCRIPDIVRQNGDRIIVQYTPEPITPYELLPVPFCPEKQKKFRRHVPTRFHLIASELSLENFASKSEILGYPISRWGVSTNDHHTPVSSFIPAGRCSWRRRFCAPGIGGGITMNQSIPTPVADGCCSASDLGRAPVGR
jgi:hypothetical protein